MWSLTYLLKTKEEQTWTRRFGLVECVWSEEVQISITLLSEKKQDLPAFLFGLFLPLSLSQNLFDLASMSVLAATSFKWSSVEIAWSVLICRVRHQSQTKWRCETFQHYSLVWTESTMDYFSVKWHWSFSVDQTTFLPPCWLVVSIDESQFCLKSVCMSQILWL